MGRYKYRLFILFLTLLLLLTGCWDQRLLKDHSLILAIGYDMQQDESIKKTVTFPKESSSSTGESIHATESEVVVTTGNTVKDAEKKMDQLIPMKFDRSKAKVIILGTDLAKNGIFLPLDSLYRDLRGPLNAKVAVADTTADQALNVNERYDQMVSDYFSELLTSTEISGIITKENVQSICPVLLSDGEDIVLPYMRILGEGGEVVIDGLALFSNDKMTGHLMAKESMMYIILSGENVPRAKLNLQISDDEINKYNNFVDFSIRKMKRKLKVDVNDEEIKAKIYLELRIEIDEYTKDNLDDESHAKDLEEKITQKLNLISEQTIEKMQRANNDSLAIGQKVRAYHNETWKSIDWEETYPNITIEPEFNVKIVRHGIIN